MWSDEDNLDLVNASFPWFMPTYTSFPKSIMRSDAVRYMYMYKFGGFYADLDVECLSSHTPLALCGSILLPLMGSDYKYPHNVPNAWMASVPGHPFWIFVLREIVKYWSDKEVQLRPYVEAVAGPCRLFEAASLYAQKFSGILSSMPIRYVDEGLIFPYDWHHKYSNPLISEKCGGSKSSSNDSECKQLLGVSKAYSITYWSHTWGSS